MHVLKLHRSVVGRVLNGSFWPTILRTDTAATANVSKRVVLLSALSTTALISLGLISVITPLGLSENISHTSFKEVEFGYVPDLQPMGKGTPERTDYTFNRFCGTLYNINCPGQDHGWNFSSNATGSHRQWDDDEAYISSVLPSNITDIFSSGSKGDRNRVAGAFDIQFRSYELTANSGMNSTRNSEKRRRLNVDQSGRSTRGTLRMYESLILNDHVNVVEGLVVDNKVGGIGFRNHTVPLDPGDGSEWTEGLLWIQPETVCVSTNLSTVYTQRQSEIRENGTMSEDIIDGGGFSDLAESYLSIDFNDTQNRPELLARAHNRAMFHNTNLMKFLGVHRNETAIGKSYASNISHFVPDSIRFGRISDFETLVSGKESTTATNLSDTDNFFGGFS